MTLDDLAPPRPGVPPRALLFGGSGQIGERVLHNLLRAGWQVVATSRRPRAVVAGVEWRVADLLQPWAAPEAFDAIVSCGPLDHFATWYQASAVQAPRVVAFGSTSGQVKQDSGDAAERDLSRRLREAEATVLQAAAARNAAATVLRPTLVYGAGRDRDGRRCQDQRLGDALLFHRSDRHLGLLNAGYRGDLLLTAHLLLGLVHLHFHGDNLSAVGCMCVKNTINRLCGATCRPRPAIR